MKSIIVLLVLVAVAAIAAPDSERAFGQYVAKFGKKYATKEEVSVGAASRRIRRMG